MPHSPGEHPFSSCVSCACISHALVANLRFWLGFTEMSLKYTPGWSSSWGTDAKEKNWGVLWERGCANSFLLPGVLSKTSKSFLFSSDSSCWEVDAPAIEIAQKKQKAGWGAALAWASSYGQVNTQKGRDCWEESGVKEYPHCTTALDEETPYQKAGKQVNTYSFFLDFFHLAMKHSLNGPLPSKRIPLWKKAEEIFTVFSFFFLFLMSALASSVRSQHNSASFTVRRCWKMGKMKELAACMKFFRKHKSVPSVHSEQLNPFCKREKDEAIFRLAKKKFCCVDTLPPPPFFQKLVLLLSRTVSSSMSQHHIHLRLLKHPQTHLAPSPTVPVRASVPDHHCKSKLKAVSWSLLERDLLLLQTRVSESRACGWSSHPPDPAHVLLLTVIRVGPSVNLCLNSSCLKW